MSVFFEKVGERLGDAMAAYFGRLSFPQLLVLVVVVIVVPIFTVRVARRWFPDRPQA